MPGMTREEMRARARAVTWYHPLDLGQDVHTRPEWHIRRRFERRLRLLQIPERLDGLDVLDIGAWDGFFSFECERRGARRVLAIDRYAWDHYGMDGFLLAREALGSRVEHRRLSAEELDPADIGAFDLVLFLGVFYHLRSPIAVLDRLRAVTRGTLICETHTLLPAVHEAYPLVTFFPGDGNETGRPHEFTAIPTVEAFDQMLAAAGFAEREVKYRPSMKLWKKAKALVTNRPQSGRLIVHAR